MGRILLYNFGKLGVVLGLLLGLNFSQLNVLCNFLGPSWRSLILAGFLVLYFAHLDQLLCRDR